MVMEGKGTEEEKSPVCVSTDSSLSSLENAGLDSDNQATSITNGDKNRKEMVVKEHEASTLTTEADNSATDVPEKDLDKTKFTPPASGPVLLDENLVGEGLDVSGTMATHISDVDKLDPNTSALHHEKGGSNIVSLDDVSEENMMPSVIPSEKESDEEHFVDALSQFPPQEDIVIWASETSEHASLAPSSMKPLEIHRALVDTAAPFESVKEAVTMFGGIVDWKAHKLQTAEKQRLLELEFEKVQKDVPEYKKQLEITENVKMQVIQELDSAKRLIEELKLNLERAQIEEEQAKQDFQFAEMRIEEIKQGITDEASLAAKAQLDAAKARYEVTFIELKQVKKELEDLKAQRQALMGEKEKAAKTAEDAVNASEEIEKTVEELTLELLAAKESLNLAHASHLEAEERRAAVVLDRDQQKLKQEQEMKMAEEEVQRLTAQLSASNDLKAKLETASSLLVNLKAELAAYMEAKLESEISNDEDDRILTMELEEAKQAHRATLSSLASTTKEMEEVRAKINKAREEVKILRVAAISLKSELDKEKSALSTMRQREGIASVTVSALEAELTKTRLETEEAQIREKEVRESMVELPRALQQAAQEADEAKSLAQLARDELHRVKEEAVLVKAGASTAESRLHAALKEIEAAKASEELALAAIKALHGSEAASNTLDESKSSGMALSLEQYYELSKKAHEAEELGNARVAAALSEVDAAREAELKNLEKLEAANRELNAKREASRVAKEKAERAKEAKLGMEQELRKWRADHEQRRRAKDSTSGTVNLVRGSPTIGAAEEAKDVSKSDGGQDSKIFMSEENVSASASPDTEMKKKKKSLLPKFVMFMAKRKASN